MKWVLLLCCIIRGFPVHAQTATAMATQPLAHLTSTFSFTVNAPMHDAAPLFGPEGERSWAGDDWNPQFVFPHPARDIEGAIFTVQHGDHTAVWINTIFNLEDGHMQYVYVLSGLLVTTIDVRLRSLDAQRTKVDVTYTRTALRPEANSHVAAMSKQDSMQGPEWERSIEHYLRSQRTRP